MSQVHKRRKSDNPFIETVWRSQNVTDGTYLATPDGSWDLITMIDEDGGKQMMLAGQATEPTHVPYRAGTGSIVISFMPSAYMPHLPGDAMLDLAEILPNADSEHFMLAGHTLPFPTFENAEKLVDEMARLGILQNDLVIDEALKGTPRAMSARAKQRHFVRTTGLTEKYLAQIYRAQAAVRLLQQGKKPIDAAADAGYTDQPHLAKSLKRIMYKKPSDVDDIHKL